MGKVLIFCEYSDVVGSAFRATGHDVTSCDLLPSEGSPNHYQGDGRHLLWEPWDLVIAHPPCTYLTKARGTPSEDDDAVFAALEFFIDCQNANAPRVAVENPTMYRCYTNIVGRPDCVVEPFHFGDLYRKRTCFWLRGLPPLMPAMGADNTLLKRWVGGSGNEKARGIQSAILPTSGKKGKEAAQTFPGMAAAMARQWGLLC